jgi:LPXTG-site transpeptidase (sortase) family protein
MDDDNRKHSDQFSASLPLPDDYKKPTPKDDKGQASAADLIRKKVDAAYAHEPDIEEEAEELEELDNEPSKKPAKSKHQAFIYNLTNSGRPLHEIQTAWHEYYAGLNDADKHEVWQEFYAVHSQTAHHPTVTHQIPKPASMPTNRRRQVAASVAAKAKTVRQKKLTKTVHIPPVEDVFEPAKTARRKQHQHFHSLLFGLGVGSVAILIFMFSFFNERIIAPFIQPSRSATNIPIINDAPVGADPEVVIPKINVEIPAIYDVNTINDDAIEAGLERGAVHYADTALPGQNGNVVIVGHSSGNVFNSGKYKFAFSLLRAMEKGDTFYLQKDGKRYTYQVYDKKVVKPTDVSVLGLSDKTATATLITCDPPGTSTNRLVIVGEQINPDPAANSTVATEPTKVAATAVIPGNSPTLWSRLVKWFQQ